MRRLLSVRVAVAGVATLAGGVGGSLALADAMGDAPAEKAAALERLVSVATTDSSSEPAPAPGAQPQAIPARMLESDVPVPISPSVLQERNGWLVGDGRTLVAVYAGAAGGDPSVGRLVIVRQNLVSGTQVVQTVDAGPTGALTISAAPLGGSVETSAQTGSIQVRTPSGRLLVLDLAHQVLHDVHGAPIP